VQQIAKIDVKKQWFGQGDAQVQTISFMEE
jgi:hypothetical protein